MQSDMPSIVGIMMARPGGIRSYDRSDPTMIVRWEAPPPTRVAPKTFAPERPARRQHWVWLFVAGALWLAATGPRFDPADTASRAARATQLGAQAESLLQELP